MELRCRIMILLFCTIPLAAPAAFGGDSCAFTSTGSLSTRIVVLLDNGAEMEQILRHPAYEEGIDYTPVVSSRKEGINGFFNEGGYVLRREKPKTLSLQPLGSDPTVASSAATSTAPLWSINGRTLALPSFPSTVADEEGIIDNARRFRYSMNYLNWLFFGPYPGDGTDLPAATRFRSAKAALLSLAKLSGSRTEFAIFNFAGDHDASSVQPMKKVLRSEADDPEENSLDPAFEKNIQRMKTVDSSPLAGGLVEAGKYLASLGGPEGGCGRDFLVVLSAGVSSEDLGDPQDHDGDGAPGGIGEGKVVIDGVTVDIPVAHGGGTYLDDVAHLLYREGLRTLTVEVAPEAASRAFLINTSNNGNGLLNLYDSGAPGYGIYHFRAMDPEALAFFLREEERWPEDWIAFAPPVISEAGDAIYLSDFRVREGNFWEGRLRSFSLSADGDVLDTAEPLWSTADWSVPGRSNYTPADGREIYTYLGRSKDLTSPGNAFVVANGGITEGVLGNPSAGREKLIDYLRGIDVFDEDGDGNKGENRDVLVGDCQHGEPLVVDYGPESRMVFFGANDGMLHAVDDRSGREAWAFIPPDQLPRLKYLIEGSEHPFYIDSSPEAFAEDADGDGIIEPGPDRVILVCGERKGGGSYFALDITLPEKPRFLWRIAGEDEEASEAAPSGSGPDSLLSELGESWSEPVFGRVKTSGSDGGRIALFVGGEGAFYAIDLYSGALLREFALKDRVASAATVIDGDGNGFVDKIYFGDLGGRLWRLGKFGAAFPSASEELEDWRAEVLFSAGGRKFYYPPAVTLEHGFDLLFVGTGDREDACGSSSDDRIYAIRDDHGRANLSEPDLVALADGGVAGEFPLSLSGRADSDGNGRADLGWFLRLSPGEKILSEGKVVAGVYYVTSFVPGGDPCEPGGRTKLYALGYKSGGAALDLDRDGSAEKKADMGEGIGAGPVPVFGEDSVRMIILSGKSKEGEAEGALSEVPAAPNAPPAQNLHLLWWKEVF